MDIFSIPDELNDVYWEGVRASRAEQDGDSNPYNCLTPESEAWNIGFTEASNGDEGGSGPELKD